jgi:hypothetical protein
VHRKSKALPLETQSLAIGNPRRCRWACMSWPFRPRNRIRTHGKWLRSAVHLHLCTDAKNTAHNLPLFATFPGARRSSSAETSRRMSNRHQRIRTGLCVVGRCRKKVARTRGKMAQIGTVVVHYAWGRGERGIRTEGGNQGGGRRKRIRSTSMSTSRSRIQVDDVQPPGRCPGLICFGLTGREIGCDCDRDFQTRRLHPRPALFQANDWRTMIASFP